MSEIIDAHKPAAERPFPFDNSYARLPPGFFAHQNPAEAPDPYLIKLNEPLARELNLDLEALRRDAVAVFSGNFIPDGAEPVAMAYAGHQFGNFVPQLGDGRAILLGEVVDIHGRRRDIQLKGGGPTPFSRRGDGRAALGPVLREYIVSEAMHALGIPTTRALAAVSTGEPVYRETVLPGAVFTRVAGSHVRVGTFQFFAARRDVESLRTLADYVIDRHYPEAKDQANPYLALFKAVADRQAKLIARWLQVGFIHGVMNTDNMTISGETIDFGPCAFLDAYDPNTVFSSIDRQGRYAYANQPGIGQWNLARLAETLLPLIDADEDKAIAAASEALAGFNQIFQSAWLKGMLEKLGIATEQEGDLDLVQSFLALLQQEEADFTNSFRALSDLLQGHPQALLGGELSETAEAQAWVARWQSRLAAEPRAADERVAAMRRANPAFIPRNHRIEQAIKSATENADFALFETLLDVLSRPYEDQPERSGYRRPPAETERVLQTFCGT